MCGQVSLWGFMISARSKCVKAPKGQEIRHRRRLWNRVGEGLQLGLLAAGQGVAVHVQSHGNDVIPAAQANDIDLCPITNLAFPGGGWYYFILYGGAFRAANCMPVARGRNRLRYWEYRNRLRRTGFRLAGVDSTRRSNGQPYALTRSYALVEED